MPTFLEPFMTATISMAEIILVANLVIGFILCISGYKLMKQLIAFTAFVLGFFIGFMLGTLVQTQFAYMPLLLGLALGLCLSYISYRLYKFGLFLYAGYMAAMFVLNLGIYPNLPMWEYVRYGCALIAFALFGWLAIKFSKPILIIITALAGAWMCMGALVTILPMLLTFGLSLLILRLILAAVGMTVQFILSR